MLLNESKHETCVLLGYYAASSGNSLPTFRGLPIGPISPFLDPLFFRFLTLEDGTNKMSRNVGKELPLLAA